MNRRKMKKLIQHFDTYFEQKDSMVLHPIIDSGLHIDVLLYKPTEKYPFWKLATMGASDYKMPEHFPTISRFNEYIMFVDPSIDLNNKEIAKWYFDKLSMIASFAYHHKCHITFEHSFEWENEDSADDKIGAFVLFPELIEDVGVLRCKTGFRKTVACLEVVLLNNGELDMLKEMGPQGFWQNYVYPPIEE
jgi:hypothetical protein